MAGKRSSTGSRKRKKKRFRGGAVLIVLLILALAAGIGLFSLSRPVRLAEPVTVTIAEGSYASNIAKTLADAGVVRSGFLFRYKLKQENAAASLRPGTYSFTGKVSMQDVIDSLQEGVWEDSVRVTIPEGKTMEQTAEIFAKAGLCTEEEFLDACLNDQFDYDYLPKRGTPERLEGFLSPNTYDVATNWSAHRMVEMLLDQFDRVYTDEWHAREKELGMSTYEIVTLASIVEREAKVQADRPVIAGVFYNRLEIGMLLQSCATVQYALGEQKEVLLYSDLEIESPYNTYKYEGLPPGPIASPGEAALEATLYPEDTDYLYFFAKPDGSHYFSTTYSEHMQAQKQYK